MRSRRRGIAKTGRCILRSISTACGESIVMDIEIEGIASGPAAGSCVLACSFGVGMVVFVFQSTLSSDPTFVSGGGFAAFSAVAILDDAAATTITA